ncbi:MAG: type II toxin-antitoxin system RelE/ParE family toxin [Silvibacterium sp.]
MRDFSYRLTHLANADIDHIWESIARDNPDAADRVVYEIYEQVRLLASFPEAGHIREDLAAGRPLLFLPAGKYMIAYLAHSHPLVVIRILHAARNLSAILDEQQMDF